MIGGNCTEYDPGNTAAVAILAALYSRGITGKGQLVEVSKQEAVLAMQRVEAVIVANGGDESTREGWKTEKLVTVMFPCKDGHVVMVTPLEHQWESLMKLIGNTEWFEKKSSLPPRVRAENPEAMIERIGSWMRQYTREEICSRAQASSCPIAPINSSEDVVNSEQTRAREIFVDMEHPEAGEMRIPSAPYQFSKTPWTLERAAPLLGQHNQSIYCERLGYSREELNALANAGVI
jgi:crotonobetainyl-CoA:carnitine CoA-transferase CaiB-like acyl-CoA transferase